MIIIDTNLLIYAYNRDAPWHAVAASWLESVFSSEEIGLPEVVLVGFIRIVTQPRILPQPISPAQSIALVESWLALPNVRLLLGTPESFRRCLDAIKEVGVAGKLCTDAQIAALAMIYKATVATVDTDFQRFAGLKLLNPLKP